MKFKDLNSHLQNKIWNFNDESFKIKFLQIENNLKWIKFSFKWNPDNSYLILFDKLLQQIYQIEENFQNQDKVKIEKALYEVLQEKQDQYTINESKRKNKITVRDVVIQKIPSKTLSNINSLHISNFRDNVRKALDILEQTDPNEVHDLYGLSFLNEAFSQYGIPENISQENVLVLEDFMNGFYTEGKYDQNQNATIWHKAINPISWFGMKMNNGTDIVTKQIKIAKTEKDFDWQNVPFIGIEI